MADLLFLVYDLDARRVRTAELVTGEGLNSQVIKNVTEIHLSPQSSSVLDAEGDDLVSPST